MTRRTSNGWWTRAGGDRPCASFRVRRRQTDLFVSSFLLGELERVLAGKFRHTTSEVRQRVAAIRRTATLVEPGERIHLVEAMDDDNRILECAVAARADYLVMGDREHLLPLRSVRGIPIITPAAFIELSDAAEPAVERRS
jgi:predicted nucleic acid-binding protein